MGDFNEVLHPHDKQGLRPACPNRMNVLREFLNTTALMDTDFSGCKFTWRGARRHNIQIREKIDRILLNWEWRQMFPHADFLAVSPVSSDHSPLIIFTKPRKHYPTHFKYEAYWGDHQGCKQVVSENWEPINSAEDLPWEKLKKNIKSSSANLQNWGKATFKRADYEIRELKLRLEDLAHHDQTEQVVAESKEIQEQIKTKWEQEEKFWGQRSRLKWLKWGDRNSKFFHATTVQRRGINKILRIKNENSEWVEGTDNILQAVNHYYTNLFTTTGPRNMEQGIRPIPKLIPDECNDLINEPPTDMEIKGAVDS